MSPDERHIDLPVQPSAWSDDGLLDQIDTAIYAVDEQGLCRRFNRAAESLFGYSQPEVLGCNLHELLHSRRPDGSLYPQEECRLLRTILSGEAASGVRETMWSRSGEAVPVECSVARLVMNAAAGAVVTLKDLRPQQRVEASLRSAETETVELLRQRDAASRAERELSAAESIRQRELASQVEQTATSKLREQQDMLRQVVDASPVGIAVLEPNLRIRWSNRAHRTMMAAVSSPADGPYDSFAPFLEASPELRLVVEEVRRTGKPHADGSFCYAPQGRRATYWNWSLTPLHDGDLLLTAIDITDQTLAHHALVHSDKMAAVGRLAASISHEINNPLEAVTNLLYLIHCDDALSATSREYVEMAQTELARVSRIASQTLRFHRHATESVTRTPQQLIEPVLALYQGKLKHAHVKVTVDFKDGTPLTTFEGDVRQILNNLIGNAIDAMDRGGELRLRTRAGRCVRTGRTGTRITITDSGHGMNEETAAHIFEPFFTTKGSGGSGLGLWISHTLAERHGGKLKVKSCQQHNRFGRPAGTTFSLFLPNHLPGSDTVPTAATLQ